MGLKEEELNQIQDNIQGNSKLNNVLNSGMLRIGNTNNIGNITINNLGNINLNFGQTIPNQTSIGNLNMNLGNNLCINPNMTNNIVQGDNNLLNNINQNMNNMPQSNNKSQTQKNNHSNATNQKGKKKNKHNQNQNEGSQIIEGSSQSNKEEMNHMNRMPPFSKANIRQNNNYNLNQGKNNHNIKNTSQVLYNKNAEINYYSSKDKSFGEIPPKMKEAKQKNINNEKWKKEEYMQYYNKDNQNIGKGKFIENRILSSSQMTNSSERMIPEKKQQFKAICLNLKLEGGKKSSINIDSNDDFLRVAKEIVKSTGIDEGYINLIYYKILASFELSNNLLEYQLSKKEEKKIEKALRNLKERQQEEDQHEESLNLSFGEYVYNKYEDIDTNVQKFYEKFLHLHQKY